MGRSPRERMSIVGASVKASVKFLASPHAKEGAKHQRKVKHVKILPSTLKVSDGGNNMARRRGGTNYTFSHKLYVFCGLPHNHHG